MMEDRTDSELDIIISERVFSRPVVGVCSYEQDCIFPPEGDSNLRPVYVAGCGCDLVGIERYGEADDKKRWGHYAVCLAVVPRYSTDLNAAHEMEGVLDRDGKGLLYAAALLDVMEIGENPRFPMRCLFALVHATARQRAIAACRVIEQEKR